MAGSIRYSLGRSHPHKLAAQRNFHSLGNELCTLANIGLYLHEARASPNIPCQVLTLLASLVQTHLRARRHSRVVM